MNNLFFKVANKIVKHTDWYDQYWGGVLKFWNMRTFNLDVVNLGSNSGKYAFDYSSVKIKGMNWAIGPQSLLHDFNIMKNYFSYLKEGATIVISLCPFSSLVSNYTTETNLKYYTFLHPATILNFDDKERIRALNIKMSPFKEMPFFCIKKTLKECVIKILRKEVERVNYDQNAAHYIDMWKKQFSIKNLEASLINQHVLDKNNRAVILTDMISFCIERGLKPVIVIPPMHPALASKFSNEFRENYIYSFIRKANTANIPVCDYIDHPEFKEDIYYRNSFFLSEKGAKKFTQTLLTSLNIEQS